MANNSPTSDLPVEKIEALCRKYRLGIITSEKAMAMIVTIAGSELLLSVQEQESSVDWECMA